MEFTRHQFDRDPEAEFRAGGMLEDLEDIEKEMLRGEARDDLLAGLTRQGFDEADIERIGVLPDGRLAVVGEAREGGLFYVETPDQPVDPTRRETLLHRRGRPPKATGDRTDRM
jgi:hypothetical protein